MAWLLSALLLPLAHAAAYWNWQRFTSREVALNAADIKANGAADDLRGGYHQRRSWARFWPWLGLSVVASLPCLLVSYWAFLASFFALGILLAAYFARYFSPALNVAMNLPYKPEYYASPDSASWPDAAVWKPLRASHADWNQGILQQFANEALEGLLGRVWLWGRIAYIVGLAVAAFLLFHF